MAPDEYMRSMGFWSSHPSAQRRRAWVLNLLAFVPLLLLLLAAMWMLLDVQTWLATLRAVPAWATWFVAALFFALGFLMTNTLGARWATLQHAGRIDGSSAWGENAVPGVCLFVIAVVALGVGPWWLSEVVTLPVQLRFGFRVLAVAPLAVLLLLMIWLDQPAGARLIRRRRTFLLAIAFLVAGLLGMTLLHDWAALYQHTELRAMMARWLPWYTRLEKRFIGALVLTPFLITVLGVWILWFRDVPAKPSLPGHKSGLLQWLRGLLDGIWRMMHPHRATAPDTGAVAGEDKQPVWLSEVLKKLSQSGRVPTVNPVSVEHGCGLANRPDLRFLFGDRDPTEDQAEAFDAFSSDWGEMLAARDVESASSHGGLLVQGESGSGRSTLALACAAFAALVHGRGVLILAPDERRRAALVRRIGAMVQPMGLSGYVDIAALDDAVMSECLGGRRLPNLLVATTDLCERLLYAGSSGDEDRHARHQKLAAHFEVMIVDELLDFEDVERSHIPFILDKQRLILAGQGVPLQTVVVTKPLSPVGEQLMTTRLFTERGFHSVRLRNRRGIRALRVQIETDDVPRGMEELLAACLDLDLEVVLYRRDIDRDESARLVQRLKGSQSAGVLRVLGDLDEAGDWPNVDAIFHHLTFDDDIWIAIRSRVGTDQTVIFSIGQPSHLAQPKVGGATPILADRQAEGMLIEHLRSVCRMGTMGVPIHARLWHPMGLSPQRWAELNPSAPSEQIDIDLQLDEDPSPVDPAWPFLWISGSVKSRAVIDVHSLPQPIDRLFATSDARGLFIRRGDTPAKPPSRLIQWRSVDGSPLRALDLAHVRHIKLRLGQRCFAAGIRNDGKAAYLEPRPWQGNGTDPCYPVIQVQWPSVLKASVSAIRGGMDLKLLAFRVDAPTTVDVKAKLVGLINDHGTRDTCNPIGFEYKASLSGWLLKPQTDDMNVINAALDADLAEGDRRARAWPELTAAVEFAFESCLPGVRSFARVLALLPQTDGPVAAAVIWFVQPETGGHTLESVMPAVIGDSSERLRLFKAAEWFLIQLDADKDMPGSMRRYFDGDVPSGRPQKERLSQALELVRQVQAGQF